MENISQTVPLMANLFLRNKPSEQAIPELEKLISNPLSEEEKETVRSQALSLLSPKTLAECEQLGVQLPTDYVDVTVTLGSFLFDLYLGATPRPEPPLLQTIWKKDNTRLAEICDRPIITLQDMKGLSPSGSPMRWYNVIRQVLTTEDQWKRITISGTYSVKDQLRGISMNCVGVLSFNKIIEAAGELFYEEPK